MYNDEKPVLRLPFLRLFLMGPVYFVMLLGIIVLLLLEKLWLLLKKLPRIIVQRYSGIYRIS